MLKKISFREAKKIINDNMILNHIKDKTEPVFILAENKNPRMKQDKILEIKISLRKCARLGVFKK